MDKIVKPVLFTLFVIYGLNLLVTPVTFEKGVVLAILATLLSLLEFKTERKELTQIKEELSVLKRELEENKKFSQDLSSHLSSIKAGQQIKSVGRF